MAQQTNAIIGSGTLPFTTQILPPSQRGQVAAGEGKRFGTNVVLINPEDANSVDAFATSGITVGTTAVEIIGPHNNPLPRCREVILQNTGAQILQISHQPTFTGLSSFQLSAGGTAGASRRISLPFMHNVSIYARAATGTTTVKILVY